MILEPKKMKFVIFPHFPIYFYFIPIYFPTYPYGIRCHGLSVFSSVQSLSRVRLFATLWTALPVHNQPLGFTQIQVHWVSLAIQPSYLLSSSSCPAFNLSQNQGLSNESALHIGWPKYWSFSFNSSPSNEHPGLISFRMDCLDLLAV